MQLQQFSLGVVDRTSIVQVYAASVFVTSGFRVYIKTSFETVAEEVFIPNSLQGRILPAKNYLEQPAIQFS